MAKLRIDNRNKEQEWMSFVIEKLLEHKIKEIESIENATTYGEKNNIINVNECRRSVSFVILLGRTACL